jgi:hypothetical protein
MSNGPDRRSIFNEESESTLVPQSIPSPIGITMTDGITMTNGVIECILSRSATKYFDPAATLSDDQIRELARRHHRADVLPLAELALHRRTHA